MLKTLLKFLVVQKYRDMNEKSRATNIVFQGRFSYGTSVISLRTILNTSIFDSNNN